MKALNKKLITLACATCLTVGMGAVACADTVDMGYGLQGNTSTSVKAVKLVNIPSDPSMRTAEQNKLIRQANDNARAQVNALMQNQYSVQLPQLEGNIVDGYSIYQLQGADAKGHHTAYYMTIDYSKSIIDGAIAIEKTVLEKGSDADKIKANSKHPLSKEISMYSKATAENKLQTVKGESLDGKKLAKKMTEFNAKLPEQLIQSFSQAVLADKKMKDSEKQELINWTTFGIKQLKVDATHMAYEPVQTRYGTAVKSDLRGSLGYDGFKSPFSLIGYAVPTDKGVSVQFLLSEDSSHDYWANELNHIYQTQSLKGGK